MLHSGQLGVHPPGALGVAFFVHAGAQCFIGRGGDGITQPLKDVGVLNLDDHGELRSIGLTGRTFANLLEADTRQRVPELLLLCCNPDQLGLFTADLTSFLESLAERKHLQSVEDVRERVPILLVLPNGILAEQTVQTYAEQLNESVLMERLPGVTEEMVEALLNRVVRGISLQAGGRRGAGADTVYLLERKGLLIFAGGGKMERERVEAILAAHDYPFKHARGVPGTRIEFDKAMISIVLNVGGLIHTVKTGGELIDLRMGDLCVDASKADFVERITRAVFEVGKAIGAYNVGDTYDKIWGEHRATILRHAGHVTSSLKTFREALGSGLNGVKLFSNERWLLTPLGRYAANVGMTEEEELFKSLGREVQRSMAKAIRHRDRDSGNSHAGARKMKLTAQRNISIELFEAGADDMVLVGTMLDSEHLIKLELNVHIPDEQITRSRLEMIRVPFPVCREVESAAERLVGLRIERGVVNEIARRVGGRVGCSHIKELATNIVYFVASDLIGRRAGFDPMTSDYADKTPQERFSRTRELLRDSCLAYCQTTAMGLDEQIGIRRVGEEHTHPTPLGDYDASLGVMLRERAGRFGDKVFFRYRSGDNDFALTYDGFAKQTFQIAGNLLDKGITRGDRICILSENRVEMFMLEMAAMSIGAVTVPVFAGYHPPQVAYVLNHAGPRYVVASGFHQLEKIERSRHQNVEAFYCMDFEPACAEWGAKDFTEFTRKRKGPHKLLESTLDEVNPDDLCMIMYTSGTTGPPKGVRLTHRNLISQQKAMSLMWDVDEHDVFICYLPWHHSFGGLFERFMTIFNGAELCLDDSRGRDVDRLIENWKVFKPTVFYSVPRVHDALITKCRELPEVSGLVFGGRLRFVFTAGAPLPAQIETAYRAHGIPVLEGWGLTEASPCVTATTKDDSWKSGYVGLPLPGVTVRIDADQEILVKGPGVMGGYLDDEDATARAIDRGGWLRTGDLGEFTRQGLRILGRKDGAFKLTTGEKVHPQRIENLLINESPYVSLALAAGSGENFVGALIFPDMAQLREWGQKNGHDPESLLDNPAARELFSQELQRINPMIQIKYQRVGRAILADRPPTLEQGELTPSGKIVRRVVISNQKEKLDALFAAKPSQAVIEVKERELQKT